VGVVVVVVVVVVGIVDVVVDVVEGGVCLTLLMMDVMGVVVGGEEGESPILLVALPVLPPLAVVLVRLARRPLGTSLPENPGMALWSPLVCTLSMPPAPSRPAPPSCTTGLAVEAAIAGQLPPLVPRWVGSRRWLPIPLPTIRAFLRPPATPPLGSYTAPLSVLPESWQCGGLYDGGRQVLRPRNKTPRLYNNQRYPRPSTRQ
jgi:hypothetical protein